MSCCAEKTGLARYAEDPGMIVGAYLCALLPLAAIYALDFITESWKSIRKTRRAGQIHLACSLPPLAAVIFYIHIQRLAEDYKEMATAMTAAVLCIVHILRTLWGLVQLYAFKKWNAHALHVLTRVGFRGPEKAGREEIEACSRSVKGRTESSKELSPCRRFFERLSLPLRVVVKVPTLQKRVTNLSQFFSVFPWSTRGQKNHVKEMEKVADKYMMVNSSLVDNEFMGAELPCRPSVSFLTKVRSRKRLCLTDFVASTQPEEYAVRWTASFLARFGSEWLVKTKQPTSFERGPRMDKDVIWEGDNLSNRLASLVAFTVTHRIEVVSENGETSPQLVSILTPLHVMCGDVFEPWTTTLLESEKNALPFPICRKDEPSKLDFDEYRTSIQNVFAGWDKNSFNQLNDAEKEAVKNMNSHQVALFSKLMGEQNSHLLPITKEKPSGLDLTEFDTFFGQLGHQRPDINTMIHEWDDFFDNFICVLPVHKASVEPTLSDSIMRFASPPVLQASVHVDNWLALQTGKFPCMFDEAQKEISDADTQLWGQVFSAQKWVEWRRLQLQVADGRGRAAGTIGKVKFLGCVMDTVRTYLDHWITGEPVDLDFSTTIDAPDSHDPAHIDWKPPINQATCTFFCSDQLHEALLESQYGQSQVIGDATDILPRKGLQMRVLWEIQLALMKTDNICPASPQLMMLCMLGYPSLHVSQPRRCPENHHLTQHSVVDVNEGHSHDVVIPIDTTGEAQDAQIDPQPSVDYLNAACRNGSMKYSCIRIDITEAPQPLHIIFQWSATSNLSKAWIGCNEGRGARQFFWQDWKDGFMGRICAKSEWRSTRLEQENECVPRGAILSKLSDGIEEVLESEENYLYWKGWPDFLNATPASECDTSNAPDDLDANLDIPVASGHESVSNLDGIETIQDITVCEVQCECGCEVHNMFLEGKRLSENRLGKDALKLYKDCVIGSRHGLAAERWVSDVVNKFPGDGDVRYELLYTLRSTMLDASSDTTKGGCAKFAQYDLEKLIELLGKICDKLSATQALYCKGEALFLLAQNDISAVSRCIEALEKYLIIESHAVAPSHFCLAAYHLQRYCFVGVCSDKEIGTKHFMSFCRHYRGSSISMGLLLEKGSLSRREYEKTKILLKKSDVLPNAVNVDALFESSFLWSSSIQFRIPRNSKAAFAVYSEHFASHERHDRNWGDSAMHAANRMALMYHRGAGDIGQDLAEAETLYNKMIKVPEGLWGSPHIAYYVTAMSNLAVLYGQQENRAEKSIELLRDAVEKSHGHEKLGSSAMNNLAVLNESGELIVKSLDEAKKLYRMSIQTDENPIAMYNLAFLLKFEDLSPKNQREAEQLFSSVADLSADLQSIPVLAAQLVKARRVDPEDVTKGFHVVVEEIDDCLAYVKAV